MAFDEYTGYLEQHNSSAQVIYVIHSSGKLRIQSLRNTESQHTSKTSLSGEKNRGISGDQNCSRKQEKEESEQSMNLCQL